MPKLILERWQGVLYAYRESTKQFKAVEQKRNTPLLDASVLDENCTISAISGDFHMIFDLKKDKK